MVNAAAAVPRDLRRLELLGICLLTRAPRRWRRRHGRYHNWNTWSGSRGRRTRGRFPWVPLWLLLIFQERFGRIASPETPAGILAYESYHVCLDRKSVVLGKSVDLGSRRIM